jgi:hypothetical protein
VRSTFMAPNQAVRSRRVRSGKESSRAGGVRKKTKSNASAAETQPPPDNPSDVDALRKARLEYLEKPLEERRKKMRYVGEIVAKEPATRKDAETVKKASEVRRRHKATTAGTKRSHSKVRVTVRKTKEPDEGEFVYHRAPETEADNETPGAEVASVKPVAPARSKTRRKPSVDDKQELEERRRPQRRQSEPLWRRNSNGMDKCAPGQRFGIAHLSLLLPLTSLEHLLLEKTSDHQYQRVPPTSTTNLGLPYNEVHHLPDRRLTSNCLARTQRQNIQEKPPASSPASYPLHHMC